MRRALWALLFLVVAVPLTAQTPFTFLNGGTVTAFGYYVGPYNGMMGPAGNQTPVALNCVDFFHRVHSGQTWMANLTNLGQSNLTNTRFGGLVNALTLYRQAAWLSTQYAGATNQQVGQIQAAIWSLFGTGTPNAQAQSTAYWLGLAQQNFQSVSFSNFYVVTDVNKQLTNSVQEFIIFNPTPSTTTPEPATMLLLGSGLVGLGSAARRRRRARLEAGEAKPMV